MDSVTPKTFGMLMAMFEHQTYVTGILTGINSFDQFGVELGKKLALVIEYEIESGMVSKHDLSTAQILDFISKKKQ